MKHKYGKAANTQTPAQKIYVDFSGRAVIPDGTTEIAAEAFYRNKELRSVHIPASVKKIGRSAFSGCDNLEEVIFSEGLKEIADDVFGFCKKLASVVLPDSIESCHKDAFSFMALKEPVYNASGTVLYKIPDDCGSVFEIPRGVKRIHTKAVIYSYIKEIVLPDTLEVIEKQAFYSCNYLHTLTIPASVKKIDHMSFYDCPRLSEITFLSDDTEIEDGGIMTMTFTKLNFPSKKLRLDRLAAALGISLLATVSLPKEEVPLDHCTDHEFLSLSEKALKRDPQAMYLLGEYFRKRSGGVKFYEYAANFWIYMSYKAGCPDGIRFIESWLDTDPEELLEAPMFAELDGSALGWEMKALGFSFFDPEREEPYYIRSTQCPHVKEVSSWCDEDGPDEDGFGREEYYDWWLLDDMLCPIPGIAARHSYSNLDMRNHAAEWNSMMEKAEKIVSERQHRPLL